MEQSQNGEVQKEKEKGDAVGDGDGIDLEEGKPRDVASGGPSIGQRVRRRSATRSSSARSRVDKRQKTA